MTPRNEYEGTENLATKMLNEINGFPVDNEDLEDRLRKIERGLHGYR